MSNNERGEVTFNAGEDKFIICFPNKQLCALENDLGVGIQKIFNIFMALPDMNQTRIILRRGLVKHHGEMELDEVSEIMDKLEYQDVVAALLTGLTAAFPTLTANGKAGRKKKKKK